jgi:hypothetical protein
MEHERISGTERLPIRITRHEHEGAQIVFEEFLKFLKYKYPRRTYYDLTFDGPERYRAYVAERNGRPIGVAVGVPAGKSFGLGRFVVDNEYARDNISGALIEAIKSDFTEIHLTVSPNGYEGSQESSRFTLRRDALVKLYQNMGFVHNPEGSDYEMIWNKENI